MEGATFADLMHRVYLDGDWRWNDSWLMWGEARKRVVGQSQKSADSNNVSLHSRCGRNWTDSLYGLVALSIGNRIIKLDREGGLKGSCFG
jgi:hypothetical protein